MTTGFHGGTRRACTASVAAHREWECTRLDDVLHRDAAV